MLASYKEWSYKGQWCEFKSLIRNAIPINSVSLYYCGGLKLIFFCQVMSARSSLCLSLQMAFNDCFILSYPGNPQPGDLIEVFLSGYQHWALYLGDGYVINIAPLGKFCFPQLLEVLNSLVIRRNHEWNLEKKKKKCRK